MEGSLKNAVIRPQPRVSVVLRWGPRPSISTKGSKDEATLTALDLGAMAGMPAWKSLKL